MFCSFILQESAEITRNVVHKHEQNNLSSYIEIADKAEKYKDASIPAGDDNIYESVDDHVTFAEKVKPIEISSKNSDSSESHTLGNADKLSHKYFQGYEYTNPDVLLPHCKNACFSKSGDTVDQGILHA